MSSSAVVNHKQKIYLKDYQPSAFRVKQTNITLSLYDDETIVNCELHIERVDSSAKHLQLHAEQLDISPFIGQW